MGNKFARFVHTVHLKRLKRKHRRGKIPMYEANLAATNVRDIDLEVLLPQTHFTPVELKILKLQYNTICNATGKSMLTKDSCRLLFFLRLFRDPSFVFDENYEYILNALFNALNENRDEFLSFPEYAKGFSIAMHGSVEEKAQLSFKLYDANGDGSIQREELKQFIRTLWKLNILTCSIELYKAGTRGEQAQEELDQLRQVARESDSPHPASEDKIAFTGEAGMYSAIIPRLRRSSSSEESSAQKVEPAPLNTCVSCEEDLESLIDEFFGEKQVMNYDQYFERCKNDKNLLEGFGLFEYCLSAAMHKLTHFMNNPSHEKSGDIIVDEKLCHVSLRGGLLYHNDINTNKLLRITRLADIQALQFLGTGRDIIIKTKKHSTHYRMTENENLDEWVMVILLHNVESIDNRYNSFAPVRDDCYFSPLIDGEETYGAMAQAMNVAKSQIFIAGWCFNPFIYMIRDGVDKGDSRLDKLLLSRAQSGVKIYIIIWHELSMAGMGLGTNQIQKYLTHLHPNIFCILHPHGKIFQWTHHQKILVIDQCIGFIGGLDMGFGRWDANHEIKDECRLGTLWPGEDYSNDTLPRALIVPTGPLKYKSKALHDGIDRDIFPRLPWHDTHCIVSGHVVRDIASNFITRWNHHNKITQSTANGNELTNNIYDVRLELHSISERDEMDYLNYFPDRRLYQVRAQVVRSLSPWSGSQRTEKSIQTAYCEIIRNAQHYIYIENQYFMSHTDRSPKIENLIAQAILDRISTAIQHKQVFRVYIILPMHHAGDIYDPSTHQVMKWQRRTINSMYETLRIRHPREDATQYLMFFALANHGYIDGVPHFSQVYVHSKLLLSDDRVAIIGSANINDRSMQGNHDSEIALVIEDDNTTQTMFAGKVYRSGRSIKRFRKNMWREHVTGIHNLKGEELKKTAKNLFNMNPVTLALAIRDPLSDAIFHFVKKRARENTEIYQSVFPHYPSKRHATIADYKHDLQQYLEMAKNKTFIANESVTKQLSNIRGFLVEYPLDWLKNDPLSKDAKLRLVDDNIFF